jgi:hypothetical protein
MIFYIYSIYIIMCLILAEVALTEVSQALIPLRHVLFLQPSRDWAAMG